MTGTNDDRLLTPREVAELFRVDPKTVSRWADAGKFEGVTVIRTLGGHRRFSERGIRELISRKRMAQSG